MSRASFNIIKEYSKENKQLCSSRLKIACTLGISLVPLFGFLDKSVIPEMFVFFMKMRLGVSFIIAIILALLFTKVGRKYPEILGMFFFCIIGIMIGHMTRYLGGYESAYYAGLNLVFLTMGMLMSWRLRYSIMTCSFIYGFYLIPIFLFDKIDNFPLLLNNNFFLISTITIALTSNYFAYRLRFQEFQARYNLAEAKNNLEEAYKKLKELDKLKTQFFSNISHEFRTPLTLILAPTEMMLRGKGMLSPQAKEEAKIIYNNSLRLLKLIDDLLDITKIDAQKMELDLQKGNISNSIKGIVSSVQNIAEKKKLKIFYTEKNKVPTFCYDRDKIEKVLLNLISNALKFTDKGEIEVSSEKVNEKAVIKIRDTGIGIAQENLARMFRRFVQLDGAVNRKHGGTGIGLSLSRDLVRLHQGDIVIEQSNLGRGTTMMVSLPLTLEVEKNKKDVKQIKDKDDWLKQVHKKAQYVSWGMGETLPRTQEQLSVESKKRKDKHIILVAEDDADMLNFVSLQLSNDYNVIGAKDGQEALELAKEHLPDLVVSDVMMPKMSGFDLIRSMRKDYQLKNIPVIFLTAKGGTDMKVEGLAQGADDYLVKPFNSDELLARVKNLIMIRELQQELYNIAKMASVGQLAAGTAHEINTPLSATMSSVRILRRELDKQEKFSNKEEITGLISKSYSSLERIEKIVKDLLSFSRKNREGLKLDNVHEALDSTLSLLEHEIKGKIKVHKEYCPDGNIECDLSKLNQVFMNVILNSIHSIKNNGNLWVTTNRKENNFVILIRDDGEGIKKEHLSRVFDPFFTTKEVDQGVGLGLTVSHNLIKEHGGKIVIDSQGGKGTEVSVIIPIKAKG